MKLDTRNLSYEQTDLDLVARRLKKDGHPDAPEYIERAAEAKKVHSHVVDLGQIAERSRGMYLDVGTEVVNWLLAHDWTPPGYLPVTEDTASEAVQ